MQYKTFNIRHKKSPGSLAIMRYNVEDKITSIEFNPDAEMQFIRRICEELPRLASDLSKLKGYGCTIQHVEGIDLSFEAFWNYFNYKVGNRKRAKRLWDELTDQDKYAVLGAIRKYKIFINQKGQEHCYPETYLNQRRWENILP